MNVSSHERGELRLRVKPNQTWFCLPPGPLLRHRHQDHRSPAAGSSSTTTSWFSGITRSKSGTGKLSRSASTVGGGGGDYGGTIKGKNQFRGVLFKYDPKSIQDAQEIDQLISYLINKGNSEGVVLLGHSTGCQVVFFNPQTLSNGAYSRAVRATILQAPVSDREYKATHSLNTSFDKLENVEYKKPLK